MQARETHLQQWHRKQLRLTGLFLGIILLIELAVLLVKWAFGLSSGFSQMLTTYVLIPGAINCLIFFLILAVSDSLLIRHCYICQAFVYTAGITAMAFVFAWTHRHIALCGALFFMPICLTQIFGRKRVLWASFALNVACYVLFVSLLYALEPAYAPDIDNIAVAVGLLLLSLFSGLSVLRYQNELIQSAADANRQMMLDSLTKLYNHAAFYEQLDACIIRNVKEGQTFSLIVFDIDDFKRVNDQCGHDAGDTVLLALVEAMKGAMDADDMAFRYGGEEFTILTPTTAKETFSLAQSIRLDFARRTQEMPLGQRVTVSAGVCQFDPVRFTGRREFFASADEALYVAKRSGKNKVVIWNEALLARP